MKKVFTWKQQKSLSIEFQIIRRLYINNFPTWFSVTLELLQDMKGHCYALDLECELALALKTEQNLTIHESIEAVEALWKSKC